MRLAFVLLLLGGCIPIPEPSNDEVNAPPGADEATEVAVSTWSELLNEQLSDPPIIRWFAGECLDYGDKCVFGRYHTRYPGTPDEIHLVVRDTIHQTQLAHELLHWVIFDGDHSSSEWLMVPDVNEAMESAGF